MYVIIKIGCVWRHLLSMPGANSRWRHRSVRTALNTKTSNNTYSLYVALKPCMSHKASTACFTSAHEYTSSQILHIYGVSVVICGGLLTRLAAANHHKPPPKRRKYAGVGTMGIPAIREHRAPQTRLGYFEGAKLLAFVPNSGGFCSGLPAFHCFHYLSSQILVVICGDLWWFVVICGGLWWFAVICGGLWWFVVVCGGLWSFAVVCDGLWWFVL